MHAADRGYMEAFGLTKDELDLMCRRNPAKIVARAG